MLEQLAHSTPGTSVYAKPIFEAGTDSPYPIWFLDPQGIYYRSILGIAQRSSDVLLAFHDATSLPWWATVVCVGVGVRLALLPLTMYSMRNASRSQDAANDIASLRAAYMRARAAALVLGPGSPLDRLSLVATLGRGVQASLHKARCYPLRSLFVPFLQVPFMVAAVLGARHAVLLGDSSLQVEGALWFTDLTIPDPTYALPITALALAYTSLDVMIPKTPRATKDEGGTATSNSSLQQTGGSGGTLNLLRGLGMSGMVREGLQLFIILTVPFTSELPAGLYLLMSANSLWTIAFLKCVRHPAVYKAITGREPVGGGSSGFSKDGFPDDMLTPRPSLPREKFASLRVPSAGTAPAATLAVTGGYFVGGGSSSSSSSIKGSAPSSPPRLDEATMKNLLLSIQQTPRMLYYEENSLDVAEEASCLVTINQALHPGLPLVPGPNPLLLRFAGSNSAAPWVNIEAMPSLEPVGVPSSSSGSGGDYLQKPDAPSLTPGHSRRPTPDQITLVDLLGEKEEGGGDSVAAGSAAEKGPLIYEAFSELWPWSVVNPGGMSSWGGASLRKQQQQQQQQLPHTLQQREEPSTILAQPLHHTNDDVYPKVDSTGPLPAGRQQQHRTKTQQQQAEKQIPSISLSLFPLPFTGMSGAYSAPPSLLPWSHQWESLTSASDPGVSVGGFAPPSPLVLPGGRPTLFSRSRGLGVGTGVLSAADKFSPLVSFLGASEGLNGNCSSSSSSVLPSRQLREEYRGRATSPTLYRYGSRKGGRRLRQRPVLREGSGSLWEFPNSSNNNRARRMKTSASQDAPSISRKEPPLGLGTEDNQSGVAPGFEEIASELASIVGTLPTSPAPLGGETPSSMTPPLQLARALRTLGEGLAHENTFLFSGGVPRGGVNLSSGNKGGVAARPAAKLLFTDTGVMMRSGATEQAAFLPFFLRLTTVGEEREVDGGSGVKSGVGGRGGPGGEAGVGRKRRGKQGRVGSVAGGKKD